MFLNLKSPAGSENVFVPLPALRLRTLLPPIFRNDLGLGGRLNPPWDLEGVS